MSKVLVVGSRKNHDAREFRDACRAVGAALARHGHTIVAAGCGEDDAETWVLDGANSALAPGKKTNVIPFAPAVPGTQDVLVDTPAIAARWPNLTLQEPYQTKGPWAVGQAVALIRSDVALLVGGGVLTANVGSLALELQKPYYALAALGGAAKTIADEDYAKHRNMGMPQVWLHSPPASPDFGEHAVQAIEFLMKNQSETAALRNNTWILIASLGILTAFLGFLFRHDPFGSEPLLVYTTCLGAITGVMLSFLMGRVTGGNGIRLSALIGQFSLACFLGVLYGFFTLQAGSLYRAEITKWPQAAVDSLAIKMALLGVAVGALLGPASKRALEELGRTAKIKVE